MSTASRFDAGRWAALLGLAMPLLLAGCGGGGSSPLDNPAQIANPGADAGQKLSFAYYQKCINPIFLLQLPIQGTSVTNTCAAGGCHDVSTGSGGSFRINQGATTVALGGTPDAAALRQTDMYKNFKSAQGQVVFADPTASRLLNKPLVRGVLHGGGRIFLDESDPNVRLLLYWMSHPAPQGQDEFTAPEPASCAA
ncbi:hypothetical protein [Pelomonas cellulosilytica]|uniref:Lipoprotein n=1 Tax=Pelomonas cellulosilytica TaxID=2906762 RepID=A0ABS8XJ82_9BURK|nr:hypothetical protein [Pelomonas sp. P8]MCE4552919.1 hypothetical protein [Pelomonas sp. P8]